MRGRVVKFQDCFLTFVLDNSTSSLGEHPVFAALVSPTITFDGEKRQSEIRLLSRATPPPTRPVEREANTQNCQKHINKLSKSFCNVTTVQYCTQQVAPHLS